MVYKALLLLLPLHVEPRYLLQELQLQLRPVGMYQMFHYYAGVVQYMIVHVCVSEELLDRNVHPRKVLLHVAVICVHHDLFSIC